MVQALIIREVCTGGNYHSGSISKTSVTRRYEVLTADRQYIDCCLTLAGARRLVKRLGAIATIERNTLQAYMNIRGYNDNLNT